MKKIDLVYIVEDDLIASFVIKKVVDEHPEVEGSQVFANGRLALDALLTIFENCNKLPDLILLDINMPVMDGWEFLEALAGVDKDTPIPVFILTSSISPVDIEKAKSYGEVKGFFSKPFSFEKLNEIMGKA